MPPRRYSRYIRCYIYLYVHVGNQGTTVHVYRLPLVFRLLPQLLTAAAIARRTLTVLRQQRLPLPRQSVNLSGWSRLPVPW
jgi:hypothetical protein